MKILLLFTAVVFFVNSCKDTCSEASDRIRSAKTADQELRAFQNLKDHCKQYEVAFFDPRGEILKHSSAGFKFDQVKFIEISTDNWSVRHNLIDVRNLSLLLGE